MKDKNVAGILALLFGYFGIHRFYLGQVGLGVLYVLLLFTGISFVLGLIDAIVLLSMDKDAFDIKYNREYYRTERRSDVDFDRRRQNSRQYEQRRAPQQSYQRAPRPTTPTPPRQAVRPHNPYKSSGLKKYREYDYDGAIEEFLKAIELEPRDVATHFNLACAYSLNENTKKSLFHLDKAVEYGFDDFERIKKHDALAFVRIQEDFDDFVVNGFRLSPSSRPAEAEDVGESGDLLEQLKKLGELREKGLLTEEEFTAQKKRLLDH
jgi:TM2 domain-containing membrane protein YozV